jgi:heme oxygenase
MIDGRNAWSTLATYQHCRASSALRVLWSLQLASRPTTKIFFLTSTSTIMRLLTVGLLVSSIGVVVVIDGFSISPIRSARPFGVSLSVSHRSTQPLWSTTSSEADVTTTVKFETELRAAAMKLHTKKQAREGEAEEAQPASNEPYVPTHDDYLAFLVDSKHVYEAFEEVVNEKPELAVFRNTGLERTKCLEKDIEFMVKEFDLIRPQVGARGKEYAAELRRLSREGTIPEFMCHFYNFYFAHTAGGRMIGKQMSALLLENRTIEFYKVSWS